MSYRQSLDPETGLEVQIHVYKDVENVPELREKLLNGSLTCCIVKASLIVDPFQIVIATNKAAMSTKLKTKTLYSEILFNLSVSKDITQSLKTFGIHDNENDLIIVVVQKIGEASGIEKTICEQINGTLVDIDELKHFTNVNVVKKLYKIGEDEFNNIPLLSSIVSKIAIKDIS